VLHRVILPAPAAKRARSSWLELRRMMTRFLLFHQTQDTTSFAASVMLLILLPVPPIAFLPLHLTFPPCVESAVLLLAEVAVGITVVADGFKAGLTPRVVVSTVGANLAIMLVGVMSRWV
jgi:hypothetical protein